MAKEAGDERKKLEDEVEVVTRIGKYGEGVHRSLRLSFKITGDRRGGPSEI